MDAAKYSKQAKRIKIERDEATIGLASNVWHRLIASYTCIWPIVINYYWFTSSFLNTKWTNRFWSKWKSSEIKSRNIKCVIECFFIFIYVCCCLGVRWFYWYVWCASKIFSVLLYMYIYDVDNGEKASPAITAIRINRIANFPISKTSACVQHAMFNHPCCLSNCIQRWIG